MKNSTLLIQPLSLAEAQKKSRNQYGYTGCIILTHDHRILLQLRDGGFKKFAHCISAFGGRIEEGETPEQTISRELNEELGARVVTSELIFISAYTEEVTQFTDVIYGYFWYDKHNTITGCFEGSPLFCPSAQEALKQPGLMDDVRWLLEQCQKRKLLQSKPASSDRVDFDPAQPQQIVFSFAFPSIERVIIDINSIEKFSTRRLIARRIKSMDLATLAEMDSNAIVMATLGGVKTKQETEQRLAWNLKQWEEHGHGLWLFFLKETHEFIGRASLRHMLVDDKDELELGYALMPGFWGKGFATEMAQACIEIAFHYLDYENIACFTVPTNISSLNVMKKLRFQYEKNCLHANLPHVLYRLHNPKKSTLNTK